MSDKPINGGPAYPHGEHCDENFQEGMSVRTHATIEFTKAILANPAITSDICTSDPKLVHDLAEEQADIMIKRLGL